MRRPSTLRHRRHGKHSQEKDRFLQTLGTQTTSYCSFSLSLASPSAIIARVWVLAQRGLGLVVLLLQVLLMLMELLLLRDEHLLSSFQPLERDFGSVFVCIVDIGSIPPGRLSETRS